MRLQILSDLHLDAWRGQSPATFMRDVDAILLAGDIGQDVKGLVWAQRAREKSKTTARVLYQLGNHEPSGDYHSTLERILMVAREYGIDVLQQKTVEIKGIPILGCTLWSDYAIEGDCSIPYLHRQQAGMKAAEQGIRDHITFSVHDKGVTAADLLYLHELDKAWLEKEMHHYHAQKKPYIVATHHAPHASSLHPLYKNDSTNGAFASDLSALLSTYQPTCWIHGHVHHHVHSTIDHTLIVANPLGYRPEENLEWRPEMVLEMNPLPVLHLGSTAWHP